MNISPAKTSVTEISTLLPTRRSDVGSVSHVWYDAGCTSNMQMMQSCCPACFFISASVYHGGPLNNVLAEDPSLFQLHLQVNSGLKNILESEIWAVWLLRVEMRLSRMTFTLSGWRSRWLGNVCNEPQPCQETAAKSTVICALRPLTPKIYKPFKKTFCWFVRD